jgi:hypothetical protein
MKRVWNDVIRPSIVLGSVIVFVFLVLNPNAEYLGNETLNSHARAILREKIVHGQVERSSDGQGSSGDTARHLLEVGASENAGIVDENYSHFHRRSNETKDGVDFQQPDSIHRNGIRGQVSTCTARQHPGYENSCDYVKATPDCRSGTLIEYIKIFYCFFPETPILAYTALALWLAALFYTLGNTAADFFCTSITTLRMDLHLPATLAGVTLLPFGNGAPDVFASIAAFVGHSGQGQVGLNSVLGGAMFVSSVVAGAVSLGIIALGGNLGIIIRLDRQAFIRDVGFFIVTLAVLALMLFKQQINLWTAFGFVSIYAIYAVVVGYIEYRNSSTRLTEDRRPLLPGIFAKIG